MNYHDLQAALLFSCWARKNMRQSRRKNLEAAASRRGDRFGHVGVGSVGNAFADVAARDGRLRPVLEGTVVRDGARTHDMQLEDVRLQGQQGQHASQHPAGGGFLPCAEPADALAGGLRDQPAAALEFVRTKLRQGSGVPGGTKL